MRPFQTPFQLWVQANGNIDEGNGGDHAVAVMALLNQDGKVASGAEPNVCLAALTWGGAPRGSGQTVYSLPIHIWLPPLPRCMHRKLRWIGPCRSGCWLAPRIIASGLREGSRVAGRFRLLVMHPGVHTNFQNSLRLTTLFPAHTTVCL
jgi:hypothetical protein